jgi:hypothetical protein
MKKHLLILPLLFLVNNVFSQSALVHIQGEKGNREAYFADFGVVFDRTPINQIGGPITIKRMNTTIVFENAAKPEFTVLFLEFECPPDRPIEPEKKIVTQAVAFDKTIKFRIADQSWNLRREDLKSAPVQTSDFITTSSPPLLKFRQIACTQDLISKVAIASKNENELLAQFKKLGIADDIQLVADGSQEHLEFAWSVLWGYSNRPDPSGKWSTRPTKKQKAEYVAKMDVIQKQINELATTQATKIKANLKEMDAKSDFHKIAAAIRGNRSLSRNERHMLTVWEGKSETDVAAKMGSPAYADVGQLRFLNYGNEYDNRVVVANNKGAVWEQGLYENCNVQFVLHTDSNKQFRVADVRITTNSNQIGAVVFACNGLLEAPN